MTKIALTITANDVKLYQQIFCHPLRYYNALLKYYLKTTSKISYILIQAIYLIWSGNGPSAIALSYMLAGNSPVYSGISNDELLHLRLSEMPGYPIVLQDLKELSEVSADLHFSTSELYPSFYFNISSSTPGLLLDI